MELKQLLFLAASAGFIPAAWLAGYALRSVEKGLIVGMIVVNTVDIDITLLNQPLYRGTTLGFELGLVDVIGISLLMVRLTASRWQGRPIKLLPRGSLIILLYTVAALPSLLLGPEPLYGMFELWKYLRGIACFWLFANIIEEPQDFRLLVYALLASTVLTVMKVLYDRYGLGMHRVMGFMGHSNVTAMYLYVCVAFLAAWLLDAERSVGIRWGLALGGAVVGILMTLSRGAIIMVPVIMLALVALSLIHALWPAGSGPKGKLKPNLRQLGRIGLIVGLGALGSIPVMWKSWDTLYKRFAEGNEKGTEGRMDKNKAALWMADDHPLGVGLNRFSILATTPYKYAQSYERELPDNMHYRAPVHNIYLLVAAETGWWSVPFFLLLLVVPMRWALHEFRRSRHRFTRAFTGGAMAALLSVTVHGMLEYQLRVANIWILFFAVIGALAAATHINEQAEELDQRELATSIADTPATEWRRADAA